MKGGCENFLSINLNLVIVLYMGVLRGFCMCRVVLVCVILLLFFSKIDVIFIIEVVNFR